MSLLRRLETLSHNVSTEGNNLIDNNRIHTTQKTIKRNRQHRQQTQVKINQINQLPQIKENTLPSLP